MLMGYVSFREGTIYFSITVTFRVFLHRKEVAMKSNLYASESNSTAAGSDEAGVIRFISLGLFGFMVGWLENGILRCSGWWFYLFFEIFTP